MSALVERSIELFNAPVLERGRAVARGLVDRVAFIVESLCVAAAVLLFFTFAACRFDWLSTAREWGNFWTHYAAAGQAARSPVDAFLLGVLAVLTVLTAFVRHPKARRAFDPLRSRSGDRARPASSKEHQP